MSTTQGLRHVRHVTILPGCKHEGTERRGNSDDTLSMLANQLPKNCLLSLTHVRKLSHIVVVANVAKVMTGLVQLTLQ